MEKYDITDYLKDDKELQKAVIEEFLKENAELKAKNERLKKEIKNNKSAYQVELGTYNMECGNLLEENKQLWQTLQEIKAIVCGNYEIIDPQGRKDILRLITKAESEG